MKSVNNLVAVLLALTLFSCEDVVELDIVEGPKNIIIDGGIDNKPGPYRVDLTLTEDYNATTANPRLTGATLVIIENGVDADTLLEVEAGVYETRNLVQSTQGNTYQLYLRTPEGLEYSSTVEEMVSPVPLDTLFASKEDFSFGGGDDDENKGEEYEVSFAFQDPAGVANFYRFKQYINGEYLETANDLVALSDRFFDGIYVENEIRGSEVYVGDSVKVEFFSISGERESYLNDLRAISTAGGPFSAPIAPVIGNVFKVGSSTEYALGYFQVVAYNTYETVVVEIGK